MAMGVFIDDGFQADASKKQQVGGKGRLSTEGGGVTVTSCRTLNSSHDEFLLVTHGFSVPRFYPHRKLRSQAGISSFSSESSNRCRYGSSKLFRQPSSLSSAHFATSSLDFPAAASF